MNLQPIFRVHCGIRSPARLSTYIILTEYSASSQNQRIVTIGALVGGYVLGNREPALAAHELADMHDRGAIRRMVVAGPLDRAQSIELVVADAGKRRREARDL